MVVAIVVKQSRVPSIPWPDEMQPLVRSNPMPRLRKGRFARSEQSEKRETDYAAHALTRLRNITGLPVGGNSRPAIARLLRM